MRLLQFLHPARPSLIFHWKFFITCGPVTPVGPATITDALLLLVFCDICSSSLSLSFEPLDSILLSTVFKFSLLLSRWKTNEVLTTDIISLIISIIITEEHGKTIMIIDIIFIDAKQYDGRKDISKYN